MVNFASVFVFATAITALPSLIRRDPAETLANLQSIDASTRALTTTVTNWDGSLLGALGIQSDATTVGVSPPTPCLEHQLRATGEKRY
jgi:hypothetical protein